ncbi:hypothetical protein C5471_08180 [Photorhabdus tasmaniensis]|uniref:Uncharacterized protein n=1 Tax=Photorhabdus tasmaniensis TaxID=1004159 RepID=A0ABX0GEX7_9GAMM|nr:hypothetical protein [Photorhabdus tasmaniensis]
MMMTVNLLSEVVFLLDGFNGYKVLTVVFIPFNTCFLLSLIIIGYRVLCLTNADYIRFLSFLMLLNNWRESALISVYSGNVILRAISFQLWING